MDSTTVATVVWPLMRKILPIRTMELALLLQEQVKRILLHVLGHHFTTPEGKVLIRAYIGKPGDTVVDDHTDEEIVSIVRKDLSQMMTISGNPDFCTIV